MTSGLGLPPAHRQPAVDQRQLDIFQGGGPVEEVEALKNKPQVVAAQQRPRDRPCQQRRDAGPESHPHASAEHLHRGHDEDPDEAEDQQDGKNDQDHVVHDGHCARDPVASAIVRHR